MMPQCPTQLPFELDEVVDPSLVTSHAGVPLALELFRQLGVAAAIEVRDRRICTDFAHGLIRTAGPFRPAPASREAVFQLPIR